MDSHFPLDADYREHDMVCGIDEAGRGCLAGPVVTASVTWHWPSLASRDWFSLLADSKTLDPDRRQFLYPHILANAFSIKTAVISHIVIDYLNILRATLHGFELVAPRYDPAVPLLIDGNQKPPSLGFAKTVVKGDRKLSAVAAAGIVAKVVRDALMERLAERLAKRLAKRLADRHGNPRQEKREPYGFHAHKGYATPGHRLALQRSGPSAYHRKSYRPVRDLLPEATPADLDFLDEATRVPAPRLVSLWHTFGESYAAFSLAGANRILERFQERGLRVLPSVHDAAVGLAGHAGTPEREAKIPILASP